MCTKKPHIPAVAFDKKKEKSAREGVEWLNVLYWGIKLVVQGWELG